MSGNTIGKILTLTSFGESHGSGIGGVLDGFPAGIKVNYNLVKKKLLMRKTLVNSGSSKRCEPDEVQYLSGICNGMTTGAPIAFYVENRDAHSEDYQENVLKPSHASYTYLKKYGFFDFKGGGRASARETLVRVVGGCFAEMLLGTEDIKILAYTSQVGNIKSEKRNVIITEAMKKLLAEVADKKDTIGAVVTCIVYNLPTGLGEPVFDKLQADLAKGMMSINAAKGFEIGRGFASAEMRGSEHNDLYNSDFTTKTNNSGGIQGGISNGEEIVFRVAFKPVSSIMMDQDSINTNGEKVTLKARGRHDICVAPRVVPVVEAMSALILADHLLLNKIYDKYKYSYKNDLGRS